MHALVPMTVDLASAMFLLDEQRAWKPVRMGSSGLARTWRGQSSSGIEVKSLSEKGVQFLRLFGTRCPAVIEGRSECRSVDAIVPIWRGAEARQR